MKPLNFTPLNGVDASVDQISNPFPAYYLLYLSAQCISTGTSTGDVSIEVSNDPEFSPNPPTNFSDINQTVAITAASTTIIPKFDMCYQWARIVYAKNNGASGTLTVNVKGIGA